MIFPRWTNQIPLLIGVGAPLVLGGVVFAVWYWFSPWFTDVGYQPKQPVPFSHELHAGDMGMDCRYCHNTVEQAAHAAIPPTETCMTCHVNIKKDSRLLEPVRESWRTGASVEWVNVHLLPDYAYFDHSVHVSAGVGCVECHGRIDQMPVVRQTQPLSMGWCLDCHRAPEKRLRPPQLVTQMDWEPGKTEAGEDTTIKSTENGVLNPPEHCSGCHR